MKSRFQLVVPIAVILVVISLLTRVALLIRSAPEFDFTLLNIVGVFSWGFIYDFINASYFILPFALYLLLAPDRLFKKRWHRFTLYALYFTQIFILLFNAVAEWFFWDEFSTRFNFIAVDYLVYTNEVVGNIRESYPIVWILACIALITVLVVLGLRGSIKAQLHHNHSYSKRAAWFLLLMIFPLVSFFGVNSEHHQFSDNTYANELAGNGMYELFAAYRNNELNFEQFYTHIQTDSAFEMVKQKLHCDRLSGHSLKHRVTGRGTEKHLNVVLISVESFSASFMDRFGNTKNITPVLDSLAQHSLLFTNLFATGTRTVRGLEALSLSIPPTPGQSIVRRPNNENLFSMATVFNAKGYESKFIYGGYGYFDNMNYFFENNGYQVIDRTSLSDDQIDYENIWGVADENLFSLSLREIDETVFSGKSSFVHIMTTSNHRPFTYPDGRIDIPSHTGRNGAVKYTDFAIGKFLREASRKPWFENTLFVITADHCASSAGKTDLPIEKYHIPMLVYAPHHVPAGNWNGLTSQIDIGPTILGLLNFTYESRFYGHDVLDPDAPAPQAFISTYQKLGYIHGDNLVVLSPKARPNVFKITPLHEQILSVNNTSTYNSLVRDAVSWYQASSYAFSHGEMREHDQ